MIRMWLCLLLVSPSFADYSATDLKTNSLLARDAASSPFPANESFVLSWIPQLAQGERSTSPAAFMIQLTDENAPFPTGASSEATSTASHAPLVWSSGRISLNQTWFELPSNLTKLFAPDTTYKWRVALYSQESAAPSWSSVVSFDMAPVSAAWADAAWIGGASEVSTAWTIPSSSPIVRARAYASGVGSFQLRINGKQVSDHIMDPGEAVYDQRVLFVGFNVTQLLRQGSTPASSNTISALLGNSKWGYLDIYSNRTALHDQSGDSTRAFIMVLMVTLADGTEIKLGTSKDWAATHGPIVYDHLWHGEIYDSRVSHAGTAVSASTNTASSSPTSSSASSFPATLMKPKVGILSPQLMPPIRVKRSVQPVSVTSTHAMPSSSGARTSTDRVLFDFGENMAGYTSLSLDLTSALEAARNASTASAGAAGPAGATTIMLRMKHTEIVGEDGSAFNNFYPGMEDHHASKTCSMADWYERKWYECANQTDG
jgi:alpha-L-rhamnosidase